jgi:hypothetical protein
MMKLDEVVRELSLEVAAGADRLDADVTGAYVGDLLSRVMASVRPGTLWVTVQAHPNVVAVGVLGALAGVIVAEGVAPDPTALRKAEEEGLPLLTTRRSAYGTCAALARLGIGEPQSARA